MKKKSLRFTLLTIFPHIFDSYIHESLWKRAAQAGLVDWQMVDLRTFTKDKHRTVDARPFGGGPGLVLKLDPIYDALAAARKKTPRGAKTRVILLSPRGKTFSQSEARRLSRYDHLVFICGRYEGVDERVAEHLADEEISIGNYVLSGGELPALVIAEAVARLRKGFMHTYESLEDINGSQPTYTRPETFKRPGMKTAWKVPAVLLSGNHKNIEAWKAGSRKTQPHTTTKRLARKPGARTVRVSAARKRASSPQRPSRS